MTDNNNKAISDSVAVLIEKAKEASSGDEAAAFANAALLASQAAYNVLIQTPHVVPVGVGTMIESKGLG